MDPKVSKWTLKDVFKLVGCSIHELDKQRRRLEVEKEEPQAALEQEENKVLRAQLELGQVCQDIEED